MWINKWIQGQLGNLCHSFIRSLRQQKQENQTIVKKPQKHWHDEQGPIADRQASWSHVWVQDSLWFLEAFQLSSITKKIWYFRLWLGDQTKSEAINVAPVFLSHGEYSRNMQTRGQGKRGMFKMWSNVVQEAIWASVGECAGWRLTIFLKDSPGNCGIAARSRVWPERQTNFQSARYKYPSPASREGAETRMIYTSCDPPAAASPRFSLCRLLCGDLSFERPREQL